MKEEGMRICSGEFDFSTVRGRNKIAKTFEGLAHRVASAYYGKSSLTYNDLLSAAMLGLTYAIDKYGKHTDGEELMPFSQFAMLQMRFYILEDIKHFSHTVRVPVSRQIKERQERGYNTRSFSVSGDDHVRDEEDSATRFDLYSSGNEDFVENADELCRKLVDRLKQQFPRRTRDIGVFIDYFGLSRNGAMVGAELEKKYRINSSNATRIRKDIVRFVKTDPGCLEIMNAIREHIKMNGVLHIAEHHSLSIAG